MAVVMTEAFAAGSADFGVIAIGDLIKGVREAFDREPNAPPSAENMLVRFAEALPPIATFLNRLPLLGPKYGNHFNELGSALKDWSEGRHHPLFDVQTGRAAAAASLEVRGWANVVLAVEAIKKSGRSFRDAHRSIEKFDDEDTGAIQEVVREFEELKKLGGSKKIKTFRTEFSRDSDRGHYAEALELLDVGREFLGHLEDAAALHKFARQCVRRALWNFTYIKAREEV
jgi:hypothetical protein